MSAEGGYQSISAILAERKQIVEALCKGIFTASNRRASDLELSRKYNDNLTKAHRLDNILDYLSGHYRHFVVSIDELDKIFGRIELVKFLDKFQSLVSPGY
jgi:Cdc6-like AAA superfamily ATPase